MAQGRPDSWGGPAVLHGSGRMRHHGRPRVVGYSSMSTVLLMVRMRMLGQLVGQVV